MAHVVFVDGNRRSIQALETARKLGHEVTFIRAADFAPYDSSPLAPELFKSLTRLVALPSTMDPDILHPALARVHAQSPIDGLICLADFSIEATAAVSRLLGLRFTNPDAIERAKQKHVVRAIIDAVGLPNARYRLVETPNAASLLEAAAAIGYPCVIKPTTGSLSMMAYIVADPEVLAHHAASLSSELARLPERLKPSVQRGMLVEEKLSGDIVSVELGRFGDTWYRYIVTGRRRAAANPTLDFSFIMPAMLDLNTMEECFVYAEGVVSALGLDFGIFHIELAMTDRGPVLIECNTRLMGANLPLLYHSLTGVDLYEHVISMHLGIAPALPPSQVNGGVASAGLVARHEGVTNPDCSREWQAPFRNHLIRVYLDDEPCPGVRVEAGHSFGGFHVRGGDAAAANMILGEVLDRFESVVGVPIYK